MNAQLIMVRGLIAGLPEDEQAKVKACAERLRAQIAECGEYGILALATVSCEQAGE